MENFDYGSLAGKNGKETAQRTAAGITGAMTATAVAEAAIAAGCGSALCTVAAPLAAGLVVATGTVAVVDWLWESIF